MKQDFVIIAKERCANWDQPSGRCFGISVEALKGEPGGRVNPLDHCRLIDNEPCAYFSRVVLPGIPKETIKTPLWERKQKKKGKG